MHFFSERASVLAASSFSFGLSAACIGKTKKLAVAFLNLQIAEPIRPAFRAALSDCPQHLIGKLCVFKAPCAE
jgi:hypothetical protein